MQFNRYLFYFFRWTSFKMAFFLFPFSLALATTLLEKKIISWPRARADQFGCFLEKQFGHLGYLGYKDEKFNCALKNYVPPKNPCDNSSAWNEGPIFPQNQNFKVNPLIEQIDLAWEHGELQGIHVILKAKLTETKARQLLGLPHKAAKLPSSLMSIKISECKMAKTCLTLLAFEHLGPSDFECPKN